MKRCKHIISAIFLLSFAAIVSTQPAMAQLRDNSQEFDMEALRKLQIAEMAIAHLYVDSVDQKKLVEDAINGMLKMLDPHSSYTNAEETRRMNEPLEGNFEGIGVQFNILEDTLVVIQPTSKGSADRRCQDESR